MKISKYILSRVSAFCGGAACVLALATCGHDKATLTYVAPSALEGDSVQVLAYADSMPLASGVVRDGRVEFEIGEGGDVKFPLLAQVGSGGRIKGYVVLEPGRILLDSTMSIASGTPLNDRYAALMARLDSVEDTNDMEAYTAEIVRQRELNAGSPIEPYLYVEWLRYADSEAILKAAKDEAPALAGMPRARHYMQMAELRAKTAPGMPYADLVGETAEGDTLRLSDFVRPGRWTVVDFWASWCPYCIKELPELKELYRDADVLNFEIVGVAVRDTPEDTRGAVERFDIPWPVIYNTGRAPYGVYGFTGIPHLMLIDPEGRIAERGVTPARLRQRMEEPLKSATLTTK